MLKIDFDKKQHIIKQSFSCDQEFADVFAEIINRIIIDEYIKVSPKMLSLSQNEQIDIITNKRKEIINLIDKTQIDTKYIYSEESSDIYESYCND